jgi:hypothetical protein
MAEPTNPEGELLDRNLAQVLREEGAASDFVAADLSSLATADAAKFLAPLNVTELDGPAHRRISAYQRLMRIEPDRALAEKLVREKLSSAGQVASIPVDDFVSRHLSAFDNDRARARRFHARAVTRRTQTSLHYQDLKARSGAHYRKGLAAADTAQPKAAVGNLPNYDQLFGGQDYRSVPDALTVFSPAAYFVDLMWVVGNCITQPANALALSQRRPDLQNIRLDGNNTDVEVPYLDIVDYVLEQRFLAKAEAADETVDKVIKDTWAPPPSVYAFLNSQVFPFGLPFDLALRESQGYVELLGTSRAEIAQTFPTAAGSWPAEVLGLSPGEIDLLTTLADDPTPYFGGKSVSDLASVDVFLAQTGLSAKELDQLLYQDLGADERPQKSGETSKGERPANVNFFINRAPLDAQIPTPGFIFVSNETDVPTLKFCFVGGQTRPLSLQDLDRLNRFIRLARKLGWSFTDLDWVLQSSCWGEIDRGAILNIARIKILQVRYRLPLVELCALWSDIKPTGMGAGPSPNDLFDRTFNDPGARKGEPPFRPKAGQEPYEYIYSYSPVFQDTNYSNPKDWDSWLRMGLAVSKDDLQRIRNYLSIGNDEVTFDGLSQFYQVSRTARVMGLTVDEFLRLSQLVAPAASEGPVQGNPSLDFVWRLAEALQWLKGAGLSVDRLDFLANGTFSTHVPRTHTFVEMYDFYVKISADLPANLESAMKPSAVAAIIIDYLAQNIDAKTWKENKDNVSDTIEELVVYIEWYLFGVIGQIIAWVEQYLKGEKKRIEDLIRVIYWYLDEFIDWLTLSLGEGVALIEVLIIEIKNYLSWLIEKFIGWLRTLLATREDLIAARSTDGIASYLLGLLSEYATADQKAADQGAGQLDSKDPRALAKRLLAALLDKRAASNKPDDELPKHIDRLLDAVTAALPSRAPARFDAAPTIKTINDAIKADCKRYVAFEASESARLQASLSGFWGVPAWATEDIVPHVEASLQATSLADFVLSTPPPATPTEADFAGTRVLVFFDEFQRCASLAAWSGLSSKQAALVFAGMGAASSPHGAFLDYIRRVFTLVQLSRAFRDTNDTLVDFLQGCSFPLAAAAITSLQKITGWSQSNDKDHGIRAALTWFPPPDQKPLAGVAVLARVKACFDLADRTKVPVEELPVLLALDQLGPLAKAVRAKIGAAAWEEAKQQLARKNNPARRDALVGVAISTLQQSSDTAYIKTRRDLYEYLLIDVDMGGEAPPVSLLNSAISSLQHYFYRCMTGLEPGVSVTPDAKLWWEWMRSYRVWEANRKVFVYPENYALPSVRKNRTPLFDQLQKELHQTNITAATIETAYKSYLKGFAEVASLRTAGACTGTDPAMDPATADTILYQFGVTASQPCRHYWRSARFSAGSNVNHGRSPWQAFNVTINSQDVSPVFAFGKLFVFWMEKTEKKYSSVEAGTDDQKLMSATIETTKTSEIKIRYVYQDFHGRWSAPHDLGKPVANVSGLHAFVDTDGIIKVLVSPNSALTLDEALTCRTTTDTSGRAASAYAYSVAKTALNRDSLELLDNVPSARLIAVTGDSDMCILDTGTDEFLFVGQQGVPNPACTRLNSSSVHTLSRILLAHGIDGLLSLDAQITTETPFSGYGPQNLATPWPSDFLDFNGADGIYYWEIFFHIPRLVAHTFNTHQQFESANRWYSYFFDPTRVGSPVFYCPLHGDYSNIGSNGLTVSVQNSAGNNLVYVSDWSGAPSSALEFSGSTYVQTDDDFNTPDELTVTAWVRLDSDAAPNSYPILVESDEGSVGGSAFYLAIGTDKTGSGFPQINFVMGQDDGDGVLCNVGQPVTAGRWHHVVATSDQVSCNLYVDGVLAQTVEMAEPDDPAEIAPITIGNDGASLGFAGAISDVAIFDRVLSGDEIWRIYASGVSSSWRFKPFRTTPLPSLMAELTDHCALKDYREDPFDPHAIARLRPVAYEKATVMDYVDNLLDWGDALFRQYTRETVSEALKLYVTANDVLGRRPTDLGAAKLPDPLSYKDLQATYALGDVLDLLENHSANVRTARVALADTPNNRIAGPLMSAPSDPPANWVVGAYFELPENQQFIARFDRVEDRLYKIRHGLNIQGVRQPLPPFQPPIDPKQLPDGIAGGHGLPGYHSPPVPPPPAPYRYRVIVEKAKEFTSIVMQFGASLLAALEKRDAAHLQRLQQTHAQSLLELTVSIKQAQVDAAIQRTATLQAGLDSAKGRRSYYSGLIADGLLPAEGTIIALMADGVALQTTAVAVKTGAIPAYLIPTIFGFSDGGLHPGSSVAEAAGVLETSANILFQGAGVATTMGGFLRRAQDWQLQAQLAGDDVTQLDAQLNEADTATTIAQRDYDVLVKQIAQANEVESVLKSMFTNEELYQWLVSRLSAIYLHAYQLALDLARRAEASFKYEVPSANGSYGKKALFIAGGYWDDLHKGLYAAEGLMLDLMRMEKAYVDQDVRRLEIQKTISLKDLDIAAYVDLVTTGTCTFKIDETVLDYDFPSHENRRIKSVSLSLPALIGPYQDIHATLTRTENANVESIVLSRGLNDAGLFELRLDDPRYLPFEGRDFDGQWALEMPQATNPGLDFGSLADVIINLSYTASQGKMPKSVEFLGGLAIDLTREFPDEWDSFVNNGTLRFEITTAMFRQGLTGLTLGDVAACFFGCTKLSNDQITLAIVDGNQASGAADTTLGPLWLDFGSALEPSKPPPWPQTWELTNKNKKDVPTRIILLIDYAGEIVVTPNPSS